jgi:hypothetical protein
LLLSGNLAAAPNDPIEAIMASLDQPTDIEFIESTVGHVLQVVSERHGIKAVLDDQLRAKDAAGDFPVTRNVKGISLRAALNIILADVGLDFVIDGEKVVVMTVATAKAKWQTMPVQLNERARKGQGAVAKTNEAKINQALKDPSEPDLIPRLIAWVKKTTGDEVTPDLNRLSWTGNR